MKKKMFKPSTKDPIQCSQATVVVQSTPSRVARKNLRLGNYFRKIEMYKVFKEGNVFVYFIHFNS